MGRGRHLRRRGRKNIFSVGIGRNWSELLGLGRIESESAQSKAKPRMPEHEDEGRGRARLSRRSQGGWSNAGRSFALPILLSFFIIRLAVIRGPAGFGLQH